VSLAILQDGSEKQDLSPFLSKTSREGQLFEIRLEFVLPETVEPEQGLESSMKVHNESTLLDKYRSLPLTSRHFTDYTVLTNDFSTSEATMNMAPTHPREYRYSHRKILTCASLAVFLLSLHGCAGCQGPLTYDISPETNNGAAPTSPSTSGIIVALAGDNSHLYAVSHAAGVWRSDGRDERAANVGGWIQLDKSPFYAYSIAVDPNDSSHVAVGGRDADESIVPRSGVWISNDSGATWATYVNPTAAPLNCTSQAIPSIAFSKNSTLFFATACGIGVVAKGTNRTQSPALPGGAVAISTVTASETKLWARTAQGQVFVSTNEGTTWTRATMQPLPSNANDFSVRGDATSLGAFDNWVYMSTLGENRPIGNNYNQLLILDVVNDKWIVQTRIADSVNGTGAGGRRRVKSYVFGQDGKIGGGLQLYFGNAQEVYRATGSNRDGTLAWEKIAATDSSGVAPSNNQFANILHNDIWDFHAAQSGNDLWIASDGGVYQNTPLTQGWVTRNYGLHTQYVQHLFVEDTASDLHAAYATHDNNAWFRTAPGTWDHETSLGDASWVAGDSGVGSAAVLARQRGPCNSPSSCNLLSGFGTNLLSGSPLQGFVINNDSSFNGPCCFAAIQTSLTEAKPDSALDVVMLTKLPLTYQDSSGAQVPVAGELGHPAANGTENLVLIRNPQFANDPDINNSKGLGWQIAANNLPAGAFKFWVTGGHASPIYFVLAAQSSGSAKLFHSFGGPPNSQLTQWVELNVQGNMFAPQPFPDSGILDGGLLGPVFVNPFNSYELYVLTNKGVQYSNNGGFSFATDSVLTNLITGSGKYRLIGNFLGNNGTNVDLSAGYAMDFGNQSVGTLSAVAFNRSTPGEVAAASPFAGVFFRSAKGRWTDLSTSVPRPLTPISSLALNNTSLYVALRGRGVVIIRQFRDGRR